MHSIFFTLCLAFSWIGSWRGGYLANGAYLDSHCLCLARMDILLMDILLFMGPRFHIMMPLSLSSLLVYFSFFIRVFGVIIACRGAVVFLVA